MSEEVTPTNSANKCDLTEFSGKSIESCADEDKTQLNQEESRNTQALGADETPKIRETNQTRTYRELNVREEQFVDLVSKGDTVRGAYIKAGYQVTPNSSVNAAQKLSKPYIQDALAERRAYFRTLANVEAEDIIGAQVELAFADISLALDDFGNLDWQKARENGATRLLKKISTTYSKMGKTVNVEFYSRADALDKLAEMLGLKKAPALNNARARLLDTIEKVMRVENLTFPQAYEYIAERQREGEVQLFSPELMKQVAEERGIVVQQLGTPG